MRVWYNNIIDNTRQVHEVRGKRVKIGRGADNDIVLNSPLIAPEAAVLFHSGEGWELAALGTVNDIRIGDQRLKPGERRAVKNREVVQLWPFNLTLDLPGQVADSAETARQVLDRQAGELTAALHLDLLKRMDLETRAVEARKDSDDYLLTLERNLDELTEQHGLLGPPRAA